MKKYVIFIIALLLLSAGVHATDMVKCKVLLDNVLVSGTAGDSYVTSTDYLDLGSGIDGVDGVFSICVTTSSTAGTPNIAIDHFITMIRMNTITAPRDKNGTSVSNIIDDTDDEGEGINCYGTINIDGPYPHIYFGAHGVTGNEADSRLTLEACHE